MLHQRRDELIRRQAAEPPVFGRHNDVEPARGACDLPLGRETAQCLARCRLGDPEGRANLGRGKMIAAAGGKIADEVAGTRCGRCRHDADKVALIVTLST